MAMKSLTIYIILFSLIIKLFNCGTETKEKELFNVSTLKDYYIQFDLSENINKFNYLFVQIILCQYLSSGSHISIENQDGEIIYKTDIISSRNFIVDITNQTNNTLIINATSSDMYIQYQYIKESKSSILASGFINNYEFGNDSVTFNLTPVVNNTETTYDLYYLGKINIYNDICQKVKFILENPPNATATYKEYNNFKLKFENLEHKTGYYLVKGNNVDDVSYYYFYERINVVNRLGPFKTNNVEFFEVKSESDEYYSIFTTPGNPQRYQYLFLQIILCEPFGDQKSHISLLNENNVEIFFTDVITSRQTSIDILFSENITFMTTSPHMYIQYKYTDINSLIYPYGIIYSDYSNLEYHYLEFNITPVEKGTFSYYELFFVQNESLISGECEKLEYSLNNKPISTLNAFGDNYIDLNFTYNLKGDGKNVNGSAFIKSNSVNSTNYTYFYKTVKTTINYKDSNNDDNTVLLVLLYSIIGFCVIAVFITIYILCKQGICKRESSEEESNSISLINRNSE